MANFFKDYQAEIKNKELEKQTEQKEKQIKYEVGQIVYIRASLWDNKTKHKRYFVENLKDNYILLADTKKDALNGYGHIYHKSDILNK